MQSQTIKIELKFQIRLLKLAAVFSNYSIVVLSIYRCGKFVDPVQSLGRQVVLDARVRRDTRPGDRGRQVRQLVPQLVALFAGRFVNRDPSQPG